MTFADKAARAYQIESKSRKLFYGDCRTDAEKAEFEATVIEAIEILKNEHGVTRTVEFDKLDTIALAEDFNLARLLQ